MKYIDNDELLKFISTEKLDLASKKLKELKKVDEKKLLIKNKSSLWSEIKEHLWIIGFNKCWYSESIIEITNAEVEHYRPKNKVCKTDVKNEGYWWLAFDWTNYRLSHPICNKRRRDYITQNLRGKGNYFPIQDESSRTFDLGCEIDEIPLLLDPTNKKDVKLIQFDISNGRPVPSHSKQTHSWNYERSSKSINFYHLDEGTWNLKRHKIAMQVNILCKRLDSLDRNSDEYEDVIDTLVDYISPRSEFTKIAIQVLKEKNLINDVLI